MAIPNEHLRSILEYLHITNTELARALDYDPSLISRYVTGHRVFKASSRQMDEISDYILSRLNTVEDIEWLKKQFVSAGLPTDTSTVYRTKQSLILWLATDGDMLRSNLGGSFPGDLAGYTPCPEHQDMPDGNAPAAGVLIGNLSIVLALRPEIEALPPGSPVSMFLSSDRIEAAVNNDMVKLLCDTIDSRDLHVDMVVCVSANTRAMSRLLDCYMKPMLSGHLKICVVHGMTQTVTSTMHLLLHDTSAFLVTETTGTSAPPIATVIRNAAFIQEMQDSFDIAAKYSQPIVNIYTDDFSRNMLEILYMEFCTPGALDVIKDNLNPIYMLPGNYERYLKVIGYSGEELQWRVREFGRFMEGIQGVLDKGYEYREMISLSRLNDIVAGGSCRMAGLYFMGKGFVNLDAEGCIDILEGYIRYIEKYPNFRLLILDDLQELNQNSCWHMKQHQSITINNWQGKEPVMIHSDQLMLLREFQTRYDALWEKGSGAMGSRAQILDILKDFSKKLRHIYGTGK